MRINKGVVIENENGYHFQMGILSHHSQVFPTIRTQSTTIPNYANPNRLYIYKKWKCVESLTLLGSWLTSPKGRGMIGTSITHEPIEHQSNLVNRGDGEIYTETLKGGVTGGLDRPLKAEKDLANQFYLSKFVASQLATFT